jgi:hypothetical protein
LYRQTSFGTFGGGPAANIACPCANICGASVVKICIMSGDNTYPGGSGGSGSPPGSTVTPGGNTVPGGNTNPGDGGAGGDGAGKSWSTKRTDPDATVVWPVPSCAASKSPSAAMAAAAPPNITCITRRRFVIPINCGSLLSAG